MLHPPKSEPWPFPQRNRVSREELRRRGIKPDPSWHYDRATDTYRPPLLRERKEA